MRTVDLKYFIDFGFLQEVNRAFFHPRGMALGINPDTGEMAIFDSRDDFEGYVFDETCPIDQEKVERVTADLRERMPVRLKALSYWQQPTQNGFATDD